VDRPSDWSKHMVTEVDPAWRVESVIFTNCQPSGVRRIAYVEHRLRECLELDPHHKVSGRGPTLLDALERLNVSRGIVRSVYSDGEGHLFIDTFTPVPTGNRAWVFQELVNVLQQYGYTVDAEEPVMHNAPASVSV
jgi:hypothetical protein